MQHACESPTDYTDLHGCSTRKKSVTIRDICGKTFSRKICDNPWNLWENILSSSVRRSFPQITQIYTDIGCVRKNTNHTDVAQEISVTIRDICGKTFSRKICDNPWNLWETFSSSVRRSLPQITQIYTDIGCGEKDTNHTDVAQEISVTIRGICGKTFSQAACGGVSHRLHRFTRILGTGKKDTNHTDVA